MVAVALPRVDDGPDAPMLDDPRHRGEFLSSNFAGNKGDAVGQLALDGERRRALDAVVADDFLDDLRVEVAERREERAAFLRPARQAQAAVLDGVRVAVREKPAALGRLPGVGPDVLFPVGPVVQHEAAAFPDHPDSFWNGDAEVVAEVAHVGAGALPRAVLGAAQEMVGPALSLDILLPLGNGDVADGDACGGGRLGGGRFVVVWRRTHVRLFVRHVQLVVGVHGRLQLLAGIPSVRQAGDLDRPRIGLLAVECSRDAEDPCEIAGAVQLPAVLMGDGLAEAPPSSDRVLGRCPVRVVRENPRLGKEPVGLQPSAGGQHESRRRI